MKKDIKTVPLLCVLIFTIVMLGGCGTTESGVSKTQTNFSIVDEQGKVVKYLTTDNTDVVKIKEVTEAIFKAISNRNYETLKGDEEYVFYTDEAVDKLKENDDQTNVLKLYKDNELVTSEAGMDRFTTQFNTDGTICTATATFKIKVTSATDAFYKSMNITKDATLVADYTFNFVKQAGIWKVNEGSSSGACALK